MTMFDIIIIGAGPGGYETAADAAAHGLTVAIVERDQMGGTCLNRGCIPTKALCRNAEVINLMREAEVWGVKTGEMAFDYAPVFERKEAVVKQLREGVEMLMGAPGITAIKGEAVLKDANTVVVNGEEYQAKNIIIATGSAPRGLPIEGADLAMTSDDILAMETLPKSLCIVGGGVIGMEFAAVFSTFGVEVTVIEYCKEILPPFDKDVAKRLKTVLSKRGIKIITSAAVNGITKGDDGYTVSYELKGKPQSVTCEKVLMSVGRQPVLPQGLDAVGVTVGRRGIEVDDNMMTNVPGVYAIGDVNGRMMLAHAASAQGQRALHAILGKARTGHGRPDRGTVRRTRHGRDGKEVVLPQQRQGCRHERDRRSVEDDCRQRYPSDCGLPHLWRSRSRPDPGSGHRHECRCYR